MERAVKRPNNLPGKYTREEMDELRRRAAAHGLTLAAFIRSRLGLAAVPLGRPKGSPNRKKGE